VSVEDILTTFFVVVALGDHQPQALLDGRSECCAGSGESLRGEGLIEFDGGSPNGYKYI
jgi:hypothetical protein